MEGYKLCVVYICHGPSFSEDVPDISSNIRRQEKYNACMDIISSIEPLRAFDTDLCSNMRLEDFRPRMFFMSISLVYVSTRSVVLKTSTHHTCYVGINDTRSRQWLAAVGATYVGQYAVQDNVITSVVEKVSIVFAKISRCRRTVDDLSPTDVSIDEIATVQRTTFVGGWQLDITR